MDSSSAASGVYEATSVGAGRVTGRQTMVAAVVGSSFIGLEVAAALRQRGLEVAVIGRDALPLQRVLGLALGRFVKSVHEQHGVQFHLSASPRAIRPDQVELDSGEIVAADLVVMGVGVRPRTGLAEAAGLSVQDGVIVDALMQTSAAGVFAAGDIARYPEARLGELVRIEHWVVAERQGQAAARAMLGLTRPFRDVPFFWSVHYDVTLAYVGHVRQWDEVEVRGELAARDATVVFRRSGIALAVATVGRDRLSLEVEAALERDDQGGVTRCCVVSVLHDAGRWAVGLLRAVRPGGVLAVIDFPPTLSWLWPWPPKGAPRNRNGHGVAARLVVDEVTASGFELVEVIGDWPGRGPSRAIVRSSASPEGPMSGRAHDEETNSLACGAGDSSRFSSLFPAPRRRSTFT